MGCQPWNANSFTAFWAFSIFFSRIVRQCVPNTILLLVVLMADWRIMLKLVCLPCSFSAIGCGKAAPGSAGLFLALQPERFALELGIG